MTDPWEKPETINDATLDLVTAGAGAGSAGDIADQTDTADSKFYGLALADRNDSLNGNDQLMSAPDR